MSIGMGDLGDGVLCGAPFPRRAGMRAKRGAFGKTRSLFGADPGHRPGTFGRHEGPDPDEKPDRLPEDGTKTFGRPAPSRVAWCPAPGLQTLRFANKLSTDGMVRWDG